MHIAFLCDNTTRYLDANLTICRNLAKEFCARGHHVSILGNCEDPADPLEECVDGVTYYRFYYPINRITHQILSAYREDHSLLHLAGSLLRHPVTACVDVVRAATGYNPIENQYLALLKAVHRKQPIDMAIASGGAFYPIHALAKCRMDFLRVGYMMDPYWKNHINGGIHAKKEELFAWKRLDKMVIPTLLEQDYTDPEFAPYRHKLCAAEFPGIVQYETCPSAVEFPGEKTNLLFAGNFYDKIRRPEYLLSLMDSMPENVCLHILGELYCSVGPELAAHMEQLTACGRLKLHGSVSAEQARAAMHKADVLINLGNAIDNQLPSKIFEYFSTGKPVIHIQKIPECPCLPYMERYGNALVLSEAEPISANAEKAAAFCMEGTHCLEFDTVSARFRDCTIPYVADLFLS